MKGWLLIIWRGTVEANGREAGQGAVDTVSRRLLEVGAQAGKEGVSGPYKSTL